MPCCHCEYLDHLLGGPYRSPVKRFYKPWLLEVVPVSPFCPIKHWGDGNDEVLRSEVISRRPETTSSPHLALSHEVSEYCRAVCTQHTHRPPGPQCMGGHLLKMSKLYFHFCTLTSHWIQSPRAWTTLKIFLGYFSKWRKFVKLTMLRVLLSYSL